jgi:hypothetical protein
MQHHWGPGPLPIIVRTPFLLRYAADGLVMRKHARVAAQWALFHTIAHIDVDDLVVMLFDLLCDDSVAIS